MFFIKENAVIGAVWVHLGSLVYRRNERIYGIRNGSANEKGNNRIGEQNNFGHKTQKELADEIGVSTKQSLMPTG